MPANNAVCHCCSKSFDKHLLIQCSVCKKQFKNTCVDITTAEVRLINGNKGYDWTCNNCRAFGNDLKALIISLQEDIQSLKNNRSDLTNSISSACFEELAQEVAERNKRKNNLIIFGVKEQNQDLLADVKCEKDAEIVQAILSSVDLEVQRNSIKPIRLGKFAHEKQRPIKIALEDEYQVRNVLKKAKKLRSTRQYKNVSIASDRTPRQLNYYKQVKSELVERQNAGEADCRIKYINGVPKIVSAPLN